LIPEPDTDPQKDRVRKITVILREARRATLFFSLQTVAPTEESLSGTGGALAPKPT
jgi:hypothetical protein